MATHARANTLRNAARRQREYKFAVAQRGVRYREIAARLISIPLPRPR